MSNGIIARASYLGQQQDAARNTLKAWLEGAAFALSPRMKSAVIETIARRLKTSNPALIEQGYQDLLRATDRKPYPSAEGINNVQRLMKLRNPAFWRSESARSSPARKRSKAAGVVSVAW